MRTKASATSGEFSLSTLVPIIETYFRQKHIFTSEPFFKLVGIIGFVLFIIAPYLWAKSYWAWFETLFASETQMYLACSLGWSWAWHGTSLLIYMVIYKMNHPFLEQYKDSDRPWPWVYDPDFKEKIAKGIKTVAFNNFVLSPLFAIFMMKIGSIETRNLAHEIPSIWVYIAQVLFMMVCEDFAFYHTHRLLHHPKLYPYIHKKHHEFYDTIALSSEYAHPVEFVLGNLIPLGLGVTLLFGRAHLLSFLVFIALRLTETVESHGGYDFPWAITRFLPFGVSSKYHNHHHMKNIGNYGSFFIWWDSIYGTNSYYYNDLLAEDKTFKNYEKKDK